MNVHTVSFLASARNRQHAWTKNLQPRAEGVQHKLARERAALAERRAHLMEPPQRHAHAQQRRGPARRRDADEARLLSRRVLDPLPLRQDVARDEVEAGPAALEAAVAAPAIAVPAVVAVERAQGVPVLPARGVVGHARELAAQPGPRDRRHGPPRVGSEDGEREPAGAVVDAGEDKDDDRYLPSEEVDLPARHGGVRVLGTSTPYTPRTNF